MTVDHSNYETWTVLDHMAEANQLMQAETPGRFTAYSAERANNLATAQTHLAFASLIMQATSQWNRPPALRLLVTAAQLRERAVETAQS
jgi:hypothetical protein